MTPVIVAGSIFFQMNFKFFCEIIRERIFNNICIPLIYQVEVRNDVCVVLALIYRLYYINLIKIKLIILSNNSEKNDQKSPLILR